MTVACEAPITSSFTSTNKFSIEQLFRKSFFIFRPTKEERANKVIRALKCCRQNVRQQQRQFQNVATTSYYHCPHLPSSMQTSCGCITRKMFLQVYIKMLMQVYIKMLMQVYIKMLMKVYIKMLMQVYIKMFMEVYIKMQASIDYCLTGNSLTTLSTSGQTKLNT